MRIVQSMVNIANREILRLNTALQAQEDFSGQLLADLYRVHIDATQMSNELAQQDELIAQLREQIHILRAGLATQRLQTEVFREELRSERLLSIQIRDVLQYSQQNKLDPFVPHLEPALPATASETAEPGAAQTSQAITPATLTSVPMSRKPSFRRHGEPKAE